ncbi:MAG: helix-turn-helix domain-containing protein [candidate division NC10 bacterium]
MVTTGARGATPRQYLTRSEVARVFEVSPATVARWTREGKLPFVRTLGGQRRYARDQINDLMRGCLENRGTGFPRPN